MHLDEIDTNEFEKVASPLLKLMKQLTGLETTFITVIDWDKNQQLVVSANSAEQLAIPAGSLVDWGDSMCQLMLSKHLQKSTRIAEQFPYSIGASKGMHSFCVLPVNFNNQMIGTLCGADSGQVELKDEQVEMCEFIADALSSQLKLLADNVTFRRNIITHRHEAEVLREKVDVLNKLANTDSLTGLPNRRAFEERFAILSALAARHKQLLGLMLVDIDHFKKINDQFGHELGDQVIKIVADGIAALARSSDIPCRIGGDEFQLAAIDSTAEGLVKLADRLQNYVRQNTKNIGVSCTLSIGVATTEYCAKDELFRAADNALYSSKEAGRNQVRIYRSTI